MRHCKFLTTVLILTFMLVQVSAVFAEDPNFPDPNSTCEDPNFASTTGPDDPNFDPYWDLDWTIVDPTFDPDWVCEPEPVTIIYGNSSWTTYDGANTGGAIGNDVIRGIGIEPGGTKWIGTNGGGVAKFNGTSWQKFTTSQGLPNNTVNAITFDSAGNKWVATGGGVGKYDGSSWTKYTTSNSGLASNNCLSIAAEGTTIWIGTYDRGLSKFNGTSWTTYNTGNSGLPGVRVHGIAIEAGGTKWFTTLDGVAKFDGTTWTKYTSTSYFGGTDDIYAVAIAPNNDKWFATLKSATRFNGTTWTVYTTSQGLAGNDNRSIAVAPNGTVWAGSNGSGVSKFTGSVPWTVYNNSNTNGGLPNDTINAVAAESSTVIWFGTGDGACKYDSQGAPPPVADFVGSPTNGNAPLTVQFTDQSTNSPTAWSWTFGDGGTSTAQNPSHTYSSTGSYTVSLTASNASGSNTNTKANYITVGSAPSPPVAYFVGSPTSGSAPLTVQFTDQSTGSPTNWSWTFGDGGTSTAQNPSHTYSSAGIYTVDLTVWNVSGTGEITKANYITVSGGPPSPPVANFVGSPTSGDAPLTVQFTDQSTNSPTSWSWSFGDGGTSTSQNPSHQYAAAGSYTVTLTVSNAGGSDGETKTNYIIVTSPIPVPDFTASPTSGQSPLTVNFTDLSTGCIDTWKYNMDGVGGDDWSDSHNGNAKWTYQNPGVYTVILKVRDCATGVYYTKTKSGYITVTQGPPTAEFTASATSGEIPLTVQFTDQSTNNPANWSWNFGDGGTSTIQNPSHQYATAGSFTVSLMVSNAGGNNTNTKINYITVVDTTPPVVSCPADAVVECGQSTEPSATGSATATDNSGQAPTITYGDVISGTCPKVIERTWTATDASSNSSTCAQTITVQDTTPPAFTVVPQNKTVECDGAGNSAELQVWLAGVAASDTCGTVTITNNFSGLTGGCGHTGSATVTWTATDSCGNTATTSAIFTIVDTTAPVLTAVPQNKTVECDGAGNNAELQAWLAGAAASDTCGSVVITNNFSGLSDGCGNTGSATVTWTATDACGNIATTSATFTIVDTTAPVLTTVPQDQVVYRDGNGNTAELNSWLASVVEATDICGNVSIANNFTSFSYGCGNTGSVTVIWTAEDACGNKSTTSATFTITDPTTAVTYDGDMLLSTAGAPTVNANLVATLRGSSGNVLNIDGEQVTFTLTADGVGTVVATASSQDGVARAVQALEPAIYAVRITLGCSGLTAEGIVVVFNPQGGFATGGGWILPLSDGENTHPNNRANFGFNAKYKDNNPTGNLEFRYSDGYIDLKSTAIDQLVITGGRIVQFKGQATVNRQQGHRFFVKAIDNGEPGTNDTFEIKVWAPSADPESNSPFERAAGVLKGGNIQVHTH